MSQVVVAGSVSKKGSDEEITEQIEDAGRESNQRVDGEEELKKEDTSSVEQKQVEHRNEGEPYVIIVAVGSTQDLPSVLGQVKEQFEKRQKEFSKNVVIGPVLNPEEEKATKSVAEEISSTSDELQAELLRGCTTREERQEVAGAINEVTSALVTEFSGVTLDDVDVEALTTKLDIALTNLFQVPVAEQTPAQLVVTFVKMSLFAMVVINLCKKQWDEFSMWRFGSTVMIVGTALYKVADKHGLNAWVQNSAGGWCGLYSRVHDYIVQLTHRQTLDNSTTDGQENAVSIPWPSTNTVVLFGSLTVFVGLYAYYKFR